MMTGLSPRPAMNELGYACLNPDGRQRSPSRDERVEVLEREQDISGRQLLCTYCETPVTSLAARRDVEGAHIHTFTNPHGIVFRIGCFASAPGCLASGELSDHFTWFPGYSWQIALCGACKIHLGWRFLSGRDAFHGLIGDRLVEEAHSPAGR